MRPGSSKDSPANPFKQDITTKQILSVSQKLYDNVKIERPNEDEHFYLATTWLRRFFPSKRAYRQGNDLPEEELGEMSWTETMQFSILDPPDSIRALSLYMVYKECPREYLKHIQEYNNLMAPVTEANKNGTFMDIYKEKNPRIVIKSAQQ